MKPFQRSPECLLGNWVDEFTYRFVGNLVHYQRGSLTGWSQADIAQAVQDDKDEFKEEKGAAQLLAAEGCAKTIAENKCPLWHYDPNANGVVATELI